MNAKHSLIDLENKLSVYPIYLSINEAKEEQVALISITSINFGC